MKILLTLFLLLATSCEKDFTSLPFDWQTDCKYCADRLTANVAVIIEPRKTEPIIEIINNFSENLSPLNDWTIQVFHSDDNEKMLRDDEKIAALIKNGKIVLSKMGINNLTVPLYDRMIYSTKFWQSLRGEKNVLIFQTDAGLCLNPKKPLSFFLDYDFVGAPWRNSGPLCAIYESGGKSLVNVLKYGSFSKDEITNKFDEFKKTLNETEMNSARILYPKVGNGGLSLNNKPKWIRALEKYSPIPRGGSLPGADLFFACVAEDNHEMKVPDEILAQSFSMETVKSDRPVGFHKPWRYFSRQDLEELGKDCPILINVSKKFFEKDWGIDAR